MSDAGSAVRKYQADLAREHEERHRRIKQLQRDARRLRFAWIEGHDTLYKFKSLQNDSCAQVLDMIENSRIYFSAPDQFNDPLDCAPVFKLAKPVTDAKFVNELLTEQEEMIAKSGKAADEISALQGQAVDVRQLGATITTETRQLLRRDARVFCLSARRDHPLLWSHYADSHRGVCLHFHSRPGTLFGAARAVEYRESRLPVLVPLHYNKTTDGIPDLMVQVKADFWSYEKEYRIIGHENVDWGHKLEGRFCSFPSELLCGITLGMNVRATDKSIVVKWAAHRIPTLRVYEAFEDTEKFGLRFRWIA